MIGEAQQMCTDIGINCSSNLHKVGQQMKIVILELAARDMKKASRPDWEEFWSHAVRKLDSMAGNLQAKQKSEEEWSALEQKKLSTFMGNNLKDLLSILSARNIDVTDLKKDDKKEIATAITADIMRVQKASEAQMVQQADTFKEEYINSLDTMRAEKVDKDGQPDVETKAAIDAALQDGDLATSSGGYVRLPLPSRTTWQWSLHRELLHMTQQLHKLDLGDNKNMLCL